MSDEFTVGGPPNAFPEGTPVGTIVKGRIINREKRQSTNFDTGQLETWDNGQPKMEWVITLEDEKGEQRRLFAKGNMLKAIKQAVVDAKANSLDLWATLEVARTGQDEPKRKGLKGAWLYEAKYAPGQPPADEDW